MGARGLITIGLLLVTAGCEDKRPVFIDDPRSKGPQPEQPGTVDKVWAAAAVAYAENLYNPYRRGGHVDLAPLASANLTDALNDGRMPPLDPLCDCKEMQNVTLNAQTLDLMPGGAKVVVQFNNMGRPSTIYLYLAMTPLGYKVDDVAPPSIRRGLVYYLRTNKKTEDEILAEKQAKVDRGECDSLEEC